MQNRLDPYTLLEPGTPIRVALKYGTVTRSEWHRDQFGQPICSHTVTFTHTKKRTTGNQYKMIRLEKPKTETINYSFICY